MCKFGAVSIAGLTSENLPKLNQDYALSKKTSSGYVAIVSDGAGSGMYSTIGSKCLSKSVIRALQNENTLDDVEKFSELIINTVEKSLRTLKRLSEFYRLGAHINEFSATLLIALQSGNKCFCAHIGDGACMFFNNENELIEISLPDNGEYINETFFVTDQHWQRNLRCFELTENKANCLIMSDGVTPLALRNGGPFSNFTSPILNFLRTTANDEATEAIAAMLTSPDVKRISNDDKSLAWWIIC